MVREIDFNDEEAVLAEIAHELDLDPGELSIKEERGLTSFGAGTVYAITIRGGGHKEWNVVESTDQERELALEVVKQDLEQEPEIFNQDFLERHINEERLRRDLYDDVHSMRLEDLTDLANRNPDDFWREYEGEGLDAPEEDEDGERREPTDREIEDLAERQAEDRLRDPMEYLEDVYGRREDATKEAIRIAGIDINAAAEDAVDTDGPHHFLAHYDGQSYETDSGLVYWRAN